MSQDPLEDSIEVVRQALGFAQPTASSHRVTVITGLEAPAVIEALGHYLFEAGIAHSVRTNLAIARDLFEVNVAFANAFDAEAVRLLGADNNIDEKRRERRCATPGSPRASVTSCFCSRGESPPLAPPGPLQVLTQIHADVHSHGLDLVGIHVEGEGLGLDYRRGKGPRLHIRAHVTDTGWLLRSRKCRREERYPQPIGYSACSHPGPDPRRPSSRRFLAAHRDYRRASSSRRAPVVRPRISAARSLHRAVRRSSRS